MATGEPLFRDARLVAPWVALIAFLMISNIATLSWTLMRPRRDVRLGVIAVTGMVFAAVLLEPWWTLAAICVLYLALIPYAWVRYGRIKRQRAAVPAPAYSEGSHAP
jgi:CDP-diacylglycerol--serine O-phosphatidyltransferase